MTIYYDYDKQAWVVDGKYVSCGHRDEYDCGCYGRKHEGEVASEAEAVNRPEVLPAWENPDCICRPDPMAAMVCPYGHLLECHHPQTCDEAECSHYQVQRDIDAGLYDFEVP